MLEQGIVLLGERDFNVMAAFVAVLMMCWPIDLLLVPDKMQDEIETKQPGERWTFTKE